MSPGASVAPSYIAAQGNLLQIDEVVNGRLAVLVILDRQEIVVTGLMIHPVVGRDHGVRIQRGNDVVDDLLLAQPQFRGVDAIDFQPDRRIVHILRNVNLADSGKLANARRQILRRRYTCGPDRGC